MSATGTSLSEFIKTIMLRSSFQFVVAGGKVGSFACFGVAVEVRQANVPMRVVTALSRGIVHNVGACAVAGIGGLGNEAKRNAKTDQLRPVPRHNVNK